MTTARMGMITDRGLIVECIAPCAIRTASPLPQGSTSRVDADASVDEILNVMEEHRVRGLPVVEITGL